MQALASNLADSRRVYSNWLTHSKNLARRPVVLAIVLVFTLFAYDMSNDALMHQVVPKKGEHPLASLFLEACSF